MKIISLLFIFLITINQCYSNKTYSLEQIKKKSIRYTKNLSKNRIKQNKIINYIKLENTIICNKLYFFDTTIYINYLIQFHKNKKVILGKINLVTTDGMGLYSEKYKIYSGGRFLCDSNSVFLLKL